VDGDQRRYGLQIQWEGVREGAFLTVPVAFASLWFIFTERRIILRVLDVRAQFPGSSLADLYDPHTMPPALVKAHTVLDKAVDLAYRPQPFTGEANRMEFLFDLYEKYTADLFTVEKSKKVRNKG